MILRNQTLLQRRSPSLILRLEQEEQIRQEAAYRRRIFYFRKCLRILLLEQGCSSEFVDNELDKLEKGEALSLNIDWERLEEQMACERLRDIRMAMLGEEADPRSFAAAFK